MAVDPAMMQQMLMSRLQQPSSGSTPLNAAADLTQRAMLVHALQQGQQQQQAQGMMPGTNAMMARDPTMQALQQSPALNPALVPGAQ